MPYQEALQTHRAEIADYLAQFTRLDDDEIFTKDNDMNAFIAQEEEQKGDLSMQSEEAISNSEDYEVTIDTRVQQKVQSEQHLQDIEQALKEQRDQSVLKELSDQIKDKLTIGQADVQVSKTENN